MSQQLRCAPEVGRVRVTLKSAGESGVWTVKSCVWVSPGVGLAASSWSDFGEAGSSLIVAWGERKDSKAAR